MEQWLRAGGDPNAVHKSLKSTALQAAARGDHVECLEVGAAALLLRVCQPSRQPMPMLCSDPLNPAKHLRRCIKKYFSNGCMYGSHGGMRRACDWLASQLAAIRMEHTTCPSSRVLTTPCLTAPCSCCCATGQTSMWQQWRAQRCMQPPAAAATVPSACCCGGERCCLLRRACLAWACCSCHD